MTTDTAANRTAHGGASADVLEVTGLVRRFGDLTAVDGVSFRIAPGETYGLLGPNGAGKTTTISMVAGLLAADAGQVRVSSRRMGPTEVAPKQHLGLVPQDLAIYPELSARENLVFFGRLLALLIMLVFGAVATGAAMLLGSLVDHEGAASGVAVGLGLVLASLGGSMFPLELFPDTLRTVAHVTPHAWGYEAFAEIQRHDGGLADIATQLGVLAAMAIVLIVLGSLALRRSVARAM